MPEPTLQLSVTANPRNLHALAELGRDFRKSITLELTPEEAQTLAQAGALPATPQDALTYVRTFQNGNTLEFEFHELYTDSLLDSLAERYFDENPGSPFNTTADLNGLSLEDSANVLKLAALLCDTDGNVDPDANGATVTAKMSELGITPEMIFATDA